MRIERAFLKSKVAQRVFILFIVSTLLPLSVFAVISLTQVTKQLNKQARQQLLKTSKNLGMSIYERLMFIEKNQALLRTIWSEKHFISKQSIPDTYLNHLKKQFKSLEFIAQSNKHVVLLGHNQKLGKISSAQKNHLKSGKALLLVRPGRGHREQIYMLQYVHGPDQEEGVIAGEINPLYLLDLDEENISSNATKYCILDQNNNIIYSATTVPHIFTRKLALGEIHSSRGLFEWNNKEINYMAAFWSIPMKFEFFYSKWTIILSKQKSDILETLSYFRKIFLPVVLLSFLLVVLLSTNQIRRIMLPLEKLKQGIIHMTGNEFRSFVEIESGDEFEELAESFNAMAGQIGNQFETLKTISEIDHLILSSLELDEIVKTVTNRIPTLIDCELVVFTLMHKKERNTPQAYVGYSQGNEIKVVDSVEVSDREIKALEKNQEILIIPQGEYPQNYLAKFSRSGKESFAVFPILLDGTLEASIAVGLPHSPDLKEEKIRTVRQVANQVTIALSNARLLQELKQINWGTLIALARAVDAKSHWTSGHSQRVTKLALKIGETIGLASHDLHQLHRAALLHDIGKLGIPSSILDKPGKLTDEERKIIQNHPRMGARILEPIKAFKNIVPMVMQHHEMFNGKGYPDGISGKEICLGARILAVADCFDALISHRPYRAGKKLGTAIKIIREESGKQFDPDIVRAFWEVVRITRAKQDEKQNQDVIPGTSCLHTRTERFSFGDDLSRKQT